jgi:hypothetical protein
VSALPESPLGSDEIAVRAHVASGRFLAGVARGRWRLIDLTWPVAIVAVNAAGRPASPGEWVFRIDLAGYPQDAPTIMLWDATLGQKMNGEKYPKGERVQQVIQPGLDYLYCAYDRKGLAGHPEWATTYPRTSWNPTRDLTFALERLSDLLMSDDYAGA